LEGIPVDEVWETLSKKWESAGKRRLSVLQENESMNRGPISERVVTELVGTNEV
jgi:hypothetical protein